MDGFSFTSVDSILENENVTLEKLLAEQDILSEIRQRSNELAYNEREPLIDFFSRSDTLLQLIDIVVTPPLENNLPTDTFNRINLASDLLSMGVRAIEDTISQESSIYLFKIFNFFTSNPVSRIQAKFVVRVASAFVVSPLLSKETCDFLNEEPNSIKNILSYYEDFEIGFEFLCNLLTKVPESEFDSYMKLIKSQNIVGYYIETFRPEFSLYHFELCNCILGILEVLGGPSGLGNPFFESLFSAKNLSHLFSLVFIPGNDRGLQYGLNLVSKLVKSIAIYERIPEHEPPSEDSMPLLIEYTLKYMDKIKLLLLEDCEKDMVLANYKPISPVGPIRILVVELVISLLALEYNAVDEKLIQLDFFSVILDLFFNYPHNSILQKHVETMLFRIWDGSNNELSYSLLTGNLKLHRRIIEASKGDFLLPIDLTQNQLGNRKANTPFVFIFANKLIQLSHANLEIQKILQNDPVWTQFSNQLEQDKNEYPESVPFGNFQVSSSTYNNSNLSEGSTSNSEEESEELQDEEDDLNSPDDADLPSSEDYRDYETGNSEVLLSKQDIKDLLSTIEI